MISVGFSAEAQFDDERQMIRPDRISHNSVEGDEGFGMQAMIDGDSKKEVVGGGESTWRVAAEAQFLLELAHPGCGPGGLKPKTARAVGHA